MLEIEHDYYINRIFFRTGACIPKAEGFIYWCIRRTSTKFPINIGLNEFL